jgi:uncharacterized paraquat-inducible protein A
MPEPLRLACPHCRAKLRAPRHLTGHLCPCPRCGANVMVQIPVPTDADIMLVLPEGLRIDGTLVGN